VFGTVCVGESHETFFQLVSKIAKVPLTKPQSLVLSLVAAAPRRASGLRASVSFVSSCEIPFTKFV
jgi:hypothetical protein